MKRTRGVRRGGEMKCNYCDKEPKIESGKRVYPHRQDLREKLFWLCENCGAYVGCHGNTDKPLGKLANKEVRLLRRQAHRLFDNLWKNKKMRRKEAYQWLAVRLSIDYNDCHIGMFDKRRCNKVIKLCKKWKSDKEQV